MSALTRTSYYMIATILFGTSGATPGVAGENVSLPKQTQIESNPTKGANQWTDLCAPRFWSGHHWRPHAKCRIYQRNCGAAKAKLTRIRLISPERS